MQNIDFFIAGAAKCGTSALHSFLNQHPSIFLPDLKEIHHYAEDLLKPDDRLLCSENYASLFEAKRSEQIAGEASAFYLISDCAAQNIITKHPKAKIILILRNPIDACYSLHSQLVYNGEEDIGDFDAALELNQNRLQGIDLPKQTRIPKKHCYVEACLFGKYLKPFLESFPAEQIKILFHEDLKENPQQVYNSILEFIGCGVGFNPEISQVNPNTIARNRFLQRLLIRRPAWVTSIFRCLVPKHRRASLVRSLRSLNTKESSRESLSEAQRSKLYALFRDDIELLQECVGRDLSHWR